MCRATPAAGRELALGGFEDEAWGVLEDAVVRNQGDAEPQCGGGDPAVSVVLTLAEGVAGSLAGHTEPDVDIDQVGAGVDDLGPGDLCPERGRSGGPGLSRRRAER